MTGSGTWTVVGHYIPGFSAMSEAEAAAHHGDVVRFAEREAQSAEAHCDAPTYSARTVAAEPYFETEYRIPYWSLPPLRDSEDVTLLEVRCDGSPWSVLGALLIMIAADRALAPWDGVFFELVRER
ncbi:MAG: hypothetical protein R3E97_11485 [Candidatus Eisenbacteria bacterium]